MSYIVAQPIRSDQDHAKRVEHIVLAIPTYGHEGWTACGRKVTTTWAWERRPKLPDSAAMCAHCLRVYRRGVSDD